MKRMLAALCVAATMLPYQAGAQGVVTTPYGGDNPTPVAQDPLAAEDTPEEIAKDSARDLKDSRFYNKPGATRAQYDAAWQRCRLIARGSRTPAGMVTTFYNPAYVSPIAAGIGGGIGGMIGAAIAQGQQRRDNRRACLLIDGWRLVELPDAESAKIAAMTDEQRNQFFDTIVGATEVKGTITERTSFFQPHDDNLRLSTPLTAPGSVYLGKKVDPAAPFALAPGEAAVVLGYRRVEPTAAGRSGTIQLSRYDPVARDLVYRRKDWKKTGDTATYEALVTSADRNAVYEVQILRLTPGDYVIKGTSVGKLPVTDSQCFGAPVFHLEPGEVAYLGDFVPYMDAPLAKGGKLSRLVYTSHIDDARRSLAAKQPSLAEGLKPATLRNGATFACAGITMSRWDIEGLDSVSAPAS